MELSFIDRLVDPRVTAKPANQWEHEREFRASLCRDLGDLFNTRRAESDFDPAFVELTNTLLTFGIPDFTQYDLENEAERRRVLSSLKGAIENFEPRLKDVIVSLEPLNKLNPVLRFRIDARLRDGGDIENVSFDATVQRESRRFLVTGAV